VLPQAVVVAAAPSPSIGSQTAIGFSGGFGAAGQVPAIQAPPMQAPSMPAPVAVAAPSSLGMPPAERSPWAPPAGSVPSTSAPAPMAGAQAAIAAAAPEIARVAPAPVVAPPVVAPPVVAAPVVAAPILAAPVVAAQQQSAAAPAGRKKAGGEEASKGKFRETMWFKKGDLDAQAAVTAAEERAKTGKDAGADKADSLPIDERYKDDGSISRGDKEKYSLRTGGTQMMAAVRPDKGGAGESMAKVSEDALIGEMKGGRGKIIAAIGVGILVLIVIIVMVVR
jgi:hypothetical protein